MDQPKRSRTVLAFVLVVVICAVMIALITALLMNILQKKIEAKNPWVRLVDVTEQTTDPAQWAKNWPREFDGYRRTVDITRTRFGGSEAMPLQRAKVFPWLTRMFAGYAFSIDYRERRGHAYMLYDQEQTERVTKKPQPGACLHCHASVIPTYRRLGAESLGRPLLAGFDWPAVMKGFEIVNTMTYAEAHAELLNTLDGTPRETTPGAGGSSVTTATPANAQGLPPAAPTTQQAISAHVGEAHPVSCVDCHDPKTMELRVTRPGFVHGIQALASSSDPLPHLPSIERWRQGDRKAPFDPNVDATRQEMRSFVCGQCHVEYYCGPRTSLFFPWANGLKVEQIEKTYDEFKFDNGERFYDWKHAETGAEVLKAQHPEFELWSQGVHARAGVACADCHMPYIRQGAVKVSDHWIRSPLLIDPANRNINRACQTCHRVSETELLARAETIQNRTNALMQRAGGAVVDMIDAINAAKQAGATPQQLAPLYELQRKAQWRLDFISAENSMGFHADQEAARILAESIDFSRQAQLAARAIAPSTQPAAK